MTHDSPIIQLSTIPNHARYKSNSANMFLHGKTVMSPIVYGWSVLQTHYSLALSQTDRNERNPRRVFGDGLVDALTSIA